MQFTSLIVELVRARPRLFFWTVVLLQAALWLLLPTLLYTSPPQHVAALLAFGREYQVGTALGPPLSFWLADIAFRITGNHMFGVYLLAQVCFVVTMWAVFTLSRAIMGGQHAILAVMLTLTIFAFSLPGLEFGPDVLARPLWALMLLHAWRVIGEGRHAAWFLLSVEIGLLFLTTPMAIVLSLLLAVFAIATQRGRKTLMSFDPLFGALVVIVVALPYFIWLWRSGAAMPPLVTVNPVQKLERGVRLFGWLLLWIAGVVILIAANAPWFDRKGEEAPVIFRTPVDPFGRTFLLFFGCVPPVLFSLVSPWFGLGRIAGGEGIALLLIGPVVIALCPDLIHLRRQQVLRTIWLAAIAAPVAVLIATLVLRPWMDRKEVATSLPAGEMGQFFDRNYTLRANVPLYGVTGDSELAALVAIGAPSRPRVLFDKSYGDTSWFGPQTFGERGGLVLWHAADTAGAAPPDIVARFPGLTPEVPRTFSRLIEGRLEPFRVGWAVVRPQKPQAAKP